MNDNFEQFKEYKERIKELELQLLTEKREKAGIKSALNRANQKLEESNLLLYYALKNNEVKVCKGKVEIIDELKKDLMGEK